MKDPLGLEAAARVLASGGRVPKKFVKARPVAAGPTLAAGKAQSKVSPARWAAFEILAMVAEGRGHSDDLLQGQRMNDLSQADKNLATALVMGVLRWQIALDAAIRTHLQRPDQRLAEPVAIALRLGAFQLLHMERIPAHAALSESVELCRAAGQPHAAGMVNAILRKLASRLATRHEASPQPIFERTAAFAERLGHPLWLVERWVANYGRDAALAICESDQAEPHRGGLFVPDEQLPQIDDGSRLVAELAASAIPAVEGRAPRLWDCCAAPGGKTLVLAARTTGADLLATDVSSRRLGQMSARLRRFPYASTVKTAVADAVALPPANGLFDLILCDVPCSGTGTLGRNPEIRLRLQPEELTRQATRQAEILAAALQRLAPGGRLVYATCSLEPEENERLVDAVSAGFRKLSVQDFLPHIPGLPPLREGAVQNGSLRTLPGLDDCDGFYATILQRPDHVS